MIETWPEYLRRITAGHTQAQIAERVGVGRLSVCNWFNGKTRPKAETAIAVARVYRRPPVEALLAAAYLDHHEIDGAVELLASPRLLAATDIAAEVQRRLLELEQLTVGG
jgi:transcriptional regulator with XRE-family HTH domain